MKEFTKSDSDITVFAFRYCIGRYTTAVNTFCEYAKAHIHEIWKDDLELMDNEITKAKNRDDSPKIGISMFFNELGMDCDREEWLNLRDVIREELKRRNEAK